MGGWKAHCTRDVIMHCIGATILCVCRNDALTSRSQRCWKPHFLTVLRAVGRDAVSSGAPVSSTHPLSVCQGAFTASTWYGRVLLNKCFLLNCLLMYSSNVKPFEPVE